MSKMVVLDLETTGLDPDRHQAWEVAWQRLDVAGEVHTMYLPHDATKTKANEKALEVNRYWERFPGGAPQAYEQAVMDRLVEDLTDATIIGANPAFDEAFLCRILPGPPVWKHRKIDVQVMAMVMLDEPEPLSLSRTVDAMNSRYDAQITDLPDHTAAGDVRATRAVFKTVTRWRAGVGGVR